MLAKETLKRSKELFYNFVPYLNRTDGKPSWQWRFLLAPDNYKGRIALGANRIGKSIGGAYECMLAITGQHPLRKFPREGKGWIVGINFDKVSRICLPKFESLIPRHYKIQSRPYAKQEKIWHITTQDRNWQVQFKSADSGRRSFEGEDLDFIWFDEEAPEDIFNECMMRLIDRRGIWWMTATPILGTAWLKSLTERDDVFSTFAGMRDNPYLPIEEIEKAAKPLSEDERLVRIEGEYIVWGGKPVFARRLLREILEGLKNNIDPMYGVLEVA